MKKILGIIVIFISILFIIPSSGNRVNADPTRTGTCCKEDESLCNAGGEDHWDMYYKTDGPCKEVQ